MNREELLKELRHGSTWRLVFFSLITLGIYTGHYIRKQTSIINQFVGSRNQISSLFTNIIFVLSYVVVILIVPYVLVEEGHPIELFIDFLNRLWMILVIVWGFKAKNRMNRLLSASKGDKLWFSWLWTLLFAPYYFNYKINKLYDMVGEKI